MKTINNTVSLIKRRRGINLSKPSDIRRLLGRLINQLLTGEIDNNTLRAVSYSCSILLSVMETTDIEKRLESLEEKIQNET